MKLWLLGVNERKKVAGVRALRKIAVQAGGEAPFATLGGASTTWRSASDGLTTLLLQTDNMAVMAACVSWADDGGLIYAHTADDEFPPEPENSPRRQREEAATKFADEAAADQDEYTPDEDYQGAQLAMLMMVGADGNPATALMFTKSALRITNDPMWESAGAFLMDTFPPAQGYEDGTGPEEAG